MTTLLPGDTLALRQTNVSNPSVVHSKPSQQSFTASEDYYSLSGGTSSSNSSATIPAEARGPSTHNITRFTTPPSRYRTPLQSRDQLPSQLPSQSKDNLDQERDNAAAPVQAEDTTITATTPLRGQGARRQSVNSSTEPAAATAAAVVPTTTAPGPSMPAPAVTQERGIRRKPVRSSTSSREPPSHEFIAPDRARSSVAQDIGRDPSPPTPGQDDTPYIRFALDQLTRDEEVRGSRRYREVDDGYGPYDAFIPTNPFAAPQEIAAAQQETRRYDSPDRGLLQPATEQWPLPNRGFDEPAAPPKGQTKAAAPPARPNEQARVPATDGFLPTATEGGFVTPLDYLPSILRPFSLLLFIALILLYLALLLASAIISLKHKGLFNYGYFGDANYFVCEYLPTLLGMILFLWLVQIEVALFRITPFIALASTSARNREEGVDLPLYPKTFFLPYLGHFRAGQPVVGIFMIAAWLQIFTIPLLASTYNVYFFGHPSTGQWRWIATQGIIWPIIALYLILLISATTLLLWLRRQQTGLQWDPRSLADIIVLLERSNALTLHDDEELRHDPPRLGYWRTNKSGNEVFHTYGVAGKAARQYGVEAGRIREKPLAPVPESRTLSHHDPDLELGYEERLSRESMLPRRISSTEREDLPSHHDDHHQGSATPWFLRPSLALLWPVIAIILLIAYLVVSYLSTTSVLSGFAADLSIPVNKSGYSPANFLYSFLPALLAMIALLGWLDLDFAYRRLQPLTALLQPGGALAEHSLLLSYPSYQPGIVTLAALVNRHWRIALLSLNSLFAALLPILGGGVFWAEFYTSTQTTRITAQGPAYYALTFFLAVYAFSTCFLFPSQELRALDQVLPAGNQGSRFVDFLGLVARSRVLDDVAFRAPKGRTDLVTRLLIAAPNPSGGLSTGAGAEKKGIGMHSGAGTAGATASKVSLADSLRGFGRARQNVGATAGSFAVPRFFLGRVEGRDGRWGVGVDRVRR